MEKKQTLKFQELIKLQTQPDWDAEISPTKELWKVQSLKTKTVNYEFIF